ncbi:homocysteine S-methyltransferase family protein [Kiloniella laminariae]|uniref:Homocysteine S-methyltransferase family protein n=1 Tax=Kiloniella laminariae TaxID=454162 RepID=A0ABT4LK09_9PROT|nr:homocysteine S-methyltransferase family protein [Kiloniella laminariae]MCZ4281435.1 homocysteine S-methyltransferase family protein [Kiloniella laminariae]
MQARYRQKLPQLGSDLFLTDAGLETDLIFNHGIEIKGFAAHTLLPKQMGRLALTNYYRGFLSLAQVMDTGFILDGQTWKAHAHWAKDLGESLDDLGKANRESVVYIAALRDEYRDNRQPIVLNCSLGPKGDAYAPDYTISKREAEDYHSQQISWLSGTQVDMITAMTFTQAEEAIGAVRAAQKAGLPIAVSFTLETDGFLPTGQSLQDAIEQVDLETGTTAIYFQINCAHPDHFPASLMTKKLKDQNWAKRIKGIRCNASRMSHAELDNCTLLDSGDPDELAKQYQAIYSRMPWLNIFGGCCGSDLRHVTEIAKALKPAKA